MSRKTVNRRGDNFFSTPYTDKEHRKGKYGNVRSASCYRKSFDIPGMGKVDANSSISLVNHQIKKINKDLPEGAEEIPKLTKGWFFGYGCGSSSLDDVMAAAKLYLPDTAAAAPPAAPAVRVESVDWEAYKSKSLTPTAYFFTTPVKPSEFAGTYISKAELIALFEKYPDVRDVPHTRHHNKASYFVLQTYDNGLPDFKNNAALNSTIRNELRQLVTLIKNQTDPTVQENLLRRLTEGFTDCQPVMQRTINTLLTELSSYELGFKEIIHARIQNFKNDMLETVLYELHPDMKSDPFLQMPHLKSGYLTSVGAQFGLEGTQEAAYDPKRVMWLTQEHIDQFKALYPTRLKEGFDLFASNLSTYLSDPASFQGRGDFVQMNEWSNGNLLIPVGFGYYSENREAMELYKGMTPATDGSIPGKENDNQMDYLSSPYISPAEVKYMLEVMGFAS